MTAVENVVETVDFNSLCCASSADNIKRGAISCVSSESFFLKVFAEPSGTFAFSLNGMLGVNALFVNAIAFTISALSPDASHSCSISASVSALAVGSPELELTSPAPPALARPVRSKVCYNLGVFCEGSGDVGSADSVADGACFAAGSLAV